MIISRTPFRISFFGGGTDYPTWAEAHGGAVLSTTFDKYCYITCRVLPPFFDHKYRIAYSRVENATTVADIEHRAIRAVLSGMDIPEGLEIHCDADLPARSGLGSSSSFVVGLLHTLYAFKGQRVSQEFLAREATRIEQVVLAEHVGGQDQLAAAVGGFNVLHFLKGGGVKVDPVVLPPARKQLLNDHLMLCFTGFSRIASTIAKSKIDNLEKKGAELHQMRQMVDQALDILSDGRDLRAFGELLHDSWMMKRQLSDQVSTDSIDTLYERARTAGAIGGKILGAGGGGFMLLFVEPEKQAAVKAALGELVHVPFQFESTGSGIVYYKP